MARSRRLGDFRSVVKEITKAFPLDDGTADVAARFDEKGRLYAMEFQLPEGAAFNYEPLASSIPRIGWSDDIYSGHDGYTPRHNFTAHGFMFEANRDRVEEVLNEIVQQL